MNKICAKCHLPKDSVNDFHWRNKAKGIRQSWCKSCAIAVRIASYKKHHVKAMQHIAARRSYLKAKIYEYLRDKCCTDCSEADPIVLDFDHVKGTKIKSVCVLANQGFAWSTILSEIEKCEVVCSNCHRRRTALRAGWIRTTTDKDLTKLKAASTSVRATSEMLSLTCRYCHRTFERLAWSERSNRKQKKAGPFCSKHCSGKWSHTMDV